MYFPVKTLDSTRQKKNSITHENMSHPETFLNAYIKYYLPETTKCEKIQEVECQDQNHKAFLLVCFFFSFRMKKRFDEEI